MRGSQSVFRRSPSSKQPVGLAILASPRHRELLANAARHELKQSDRILRTSEVFC